MGKKWLVRRGAPAIGGALIVALALTLGAAAPAQADPYPTWAEVQAAKTNAAAAQKELAKIDAAVAQLQAEQKTAADAELQAAYSATLAANALQAATDKLASLTAQLATAKKQSATATARFVATEIQLDRLGGGGDLTARLLASAATSRSSDLLGKLDAMNQLGKRSSQLEVAAQQKQNEVGSLESQAATAQKARTALKTDADAKLLAAQSAQADAQAKLAAGQQQLSTLAAQAADLQGKAVSEQNAYDSQPKQTAPPGNGGTGTIDTSGVVVNPAAAQAYAQQAMSARYGWGSDQFSCLVSLWNVESGWRANAYNTSSGAYGIPQAWPANKMQTAGADWMTNADTQVDWGLSYIAGRYGTPCKAWSFETSHVPYWY